LKHRDITLWFHWRTLCRLQPSLTNISYLLPNLYCTHKHTHNVGQDFKS
jgi:hypothetical protein